MNNKKATLQQPLFLPAVNPAEHAKAVVDFVRPFFLKNGGIILLLALFGAVMLGNLGGWELKGSDEPRYAQIAREMHETGHLLAGIF